MTTRKWLAECHAWLDDPTSVQFKNAVGIWFTSCEQGWSPITNQSLTWRIKPATIMLNGVELPKPLDAAGITQTSNRIRLITDDRQENFWFNTREDRDAVYAKLVEILS